MKMIYGRTPVKSMNVRHYEMDTNSATMKPSDLQAGVVGFAKGEKVIGTGKAFEFASYGKLDTNTPFFTPTMVNVVEIASLNHPIRLSIELNVMRDIDFSTVQTIGYVTVDNVEYPITVQVNGAILTFACEKTIELQYFCGKDNYIL